MNTKQSLTISFEFFPPKSPEGSENLKENAMRLADYQPRFFSITFGALGSTRHGTLDTANMLMSHTPIKAVTHLACIGTTRAEMRDVIQEYQAAGIKRIIALRGDQPQEMLEAGDFKYASELVELIRKESGDYFHIDVAAYPEIHPQAKNYHADIMNLKSKYDAGANSAITQYFFNADAFFYYQDECAKQGVFMPIVPGIMPISQFSKLVRFSSACGAEIPRWLRQRFESYGDDEVAIKEFGLEVVYNLCEKLIAGGVKALHFYTLNKADATIEILKLLQVATVESKDDSSGSGLHRRGVTQFV